MLSANQDTYMSSSGDMKMSLKLMTWEKSACSVSVCGAIYYIFVPQVLEKL